MGICGASGLIGSGMGEFDIRLPAKLNNMSALIRRLKESGIWYIVVTTKIFCFCKGILRHVVYKT